MGPSPRPAVRSCASVEVVEPRLMLAATVAARSALVDKLGTTLAAVYQQYHATPTAAKVAESAANGVAVQAYAAAGKTAGLAKAVAKLGGTGVAAVGLEVDATVPVAKLAALSKVAGLRFARPVDYVTNAGVVTAQSDLSDAAAAARATYSLNGAGVTVGIVSDSFNTSAATDKYATDVATGDLPPNVQVLADGPATATDEGRALAQVVYDSAPSASLSFSTGAGGDATAAVAIGSLQRAGAKVIVDDVTYLDEPMFQDGTIAQAVAAATAAGVTYVSAAGNTGANDYAATWQSGTPVSAGSIPNAAGAPAFYGGTPFNFAPAGQTANPLQQFTLGAGQSIRLSVQWDSPYYSVSGGAGSPNSVDAYVLNAAGTQIVGGAVNPDAGHDPIQLVQFTNTTGASAAFNLMLVDEVGAVPGYVKYVDFSGQATNWAYASDGGSIFGHANAATSITVGGANYAQTPAYGTTPPVIETTSTGRLLSGEGGTPVFFAPNGTRLATPSLRQQPAVVGGDNVDNTFYGTDTDGNGRPNLGGTSAAAAGVAGVVALLLQRTPTLTPAQVQTALRSSAIDIGTPGVDNQSGSGLVRADAAVATLGGTVTGTVYQDNNGDAAQSAGEPGLAGVTVFADANNNGVLDAGEARTTTAANGTYAVLNVPTAAAVVVRPVLPGATVAVVASRSVAVTGGGNTPGVTFGLFPTVFTGSDANNSYTLQLDPAKTANVQILVNGTLAYEVARSLLPAIAFNLGGGDDALTVNDYYGNPVPANGLTYDGGGAATAAGNALVLAGGTGTDAGVVNALTETWDGGTIFNQNVQSVTVNADAGNDSVQVLNPTPTYQSLTINGGPGNDAVVVTNALNNNGVGTVFNGGTTATDADTLTVNKGAYTFPAGVDPATTSAHLSVVTSGAIVFPAGPAGTGVTTRTLSALTINTGGTVAVAAPATRASRAVLVTGTLSVATAAKLDLAGNDMVVTSTPLATVAGYLATGYAAGAWTGTGVTSTAAAADRAHLTALGVIQNNAVGGTALYGAGAPLGLFDGVVAPAAAAVLVRYTYYGDANLDGHVNGMDYVRADAGYAAAATASPLAGWVNGDFNYDNRIDGSDFTLLDNAFNTQSAAGL